MGSNKPKYSTNDYVEICYKEHNDRYDYHFISFRTLKDKIDIICKRCEGIFTQRAGSHLYGGNCNLCCQNTISYDLTNDIIDFKILNLNKSCKRISNYIDYHQKMIWFCELCNKNFDSFVKHVLNKNTKNSCRHCRSNAKLNNDIIDERLKNKNLNIIRVDDYIDMKTDIKWKCLKCDNYFINTPSKIIHSNRKCSHCTKSEGEKFVKEYLENQNIKFEQQYKVFINVNDKRPKLIDFYLPQYNLFIEYNGRQHYEKDCFNKINPDFNKILERDKNVRLFCKNNKINLLEIDSRRCRSSVKDDSYLCKNKISQFIENTLKILVKEK